MAMNNDILTFLNPISNDKLSIMSVKDRLQMLTLLKQYYLSLRLNLNLSKNITFGIEIEFEEAKREIIEKDLATTFPDNSWKVVNDGSLKNGGEINSPVLTNNKHTWTDLERVCSIVSNNASILDNCGGHVHIGMPILGNNSKYWYNFAILWAAFEHVIFRFLYGEYLAPRKGILEQARPISLDIINQLDRLKKYSKMNTALYILKALDVKNERHLAINFTNMTKIPPYKYNLVENKNTIELRGGNGSLIPVIWQGRIDLLIHLFLYAKSPDFDETIIMSKINKILEDEIPSNIRKYSYIYQNDALELADLIFDNNLDKIYFLRQYIKSGEVSNIPLTKSKSFVRS